MIHVIVLTMIHVIVLTAIRVIVLAAKYVIILAIKVVVLTLQVGIARAYAYDVNVRVGVLS